MDMLALAKQYEASGEHVIHMEIGQPTAPIPKAVLNAAMLGLEAGDIAYTEALGIWPLRQRIAAHYTEAYGIEVDPGRIVVTTGSSAAFNLLFLAAFNPGDRVAVSTPGYPAYRNIVEALGLEIVEIELTAESGPNITPQQLEAAHADGPLAGVLVASPANPTGSMMAPKALASLIASAESLGIRFVSDEIYHGLVYDGVADTALRSSDEAIVVNSFSKYYCMAGWRVGWMVVPEALVRPMERLAQNFYLSAPDLSQRAALGAFDATQELEDIKSGYAASRTLLLEHCRRSALRTRTPSMGRFTSMFLCDGIRMIRLISRGRCSQRPALPRHRGSTSISHEGRGHSDSHLLVGQPTWPKRRSVWRTG